MFFFLINTYNYIDRVHIISSTNVAQSVDQITEGTENYADPNAPNDTSSFIADMFKALQIVSDRLDIPSPTDVFTIEYVVKGECATCHTGPTYVHSKYCIDVPSAVFSTCSAVSNVESMLREVVPHKCINESIVDVILTTTYGLFLTCFMYNVHTGIYRNIREYYS